MTIFLFMDGGSFRRSAALNIHTHRTPRASHLVSLSARPREGGDPERQEKADGVSLDSRLRGNERRTERDVKSAAAACVENDETLPEQRDNYGEAL